MFHLEMNGSERCSWRTLGWPIGKKKPKRRYPKEVCSSRFCSAIHQYKCMSVNAMPGLFCQKAGWLVNEDKIRNISFFCWYALLPDLVNSFNDMTAQRGSCSFRELLQESPDTQSSEIVEYNLPVYTVLIPNQQTSALVWALDLMTQS